MTGDLLERVRDEIDARRKELEPHIREYERLLSAAEALGMRLGETASASARAGARTPAVAPAVTKVTAAKAAKAKAPKPSAGKPAKAPAPRKTPALDPAASKPAASAVPAGKPAVPKAPAASTAQPRSSKAAAQQSILAALEHGSHTVSELAVVTALGGPSIRESLQRLLGSGAVKRAKREGKAAYALARAARS